LELDTLFGRVKTRQLSTSMQRSETVFLKDNPQLKPIFTWLKNLGAVDAPDKLPFRKLKEKLQEIRINRECNWYVNYDMMAIVFWYSLPCQGDFENGIVEYLNLLRQALYNPEEVILDEF
jgi:hypothetical protein